MTTAIAAPERLTTHPEWQDLLKAALEMPGEAGNTYNRFRHLSIGNQVLLMMQGLFEPVHTYKGWLGLGRQVRKGSKARSIYVPLFRKEEKDGEKVEKLMGFKLVPSMFGVSDTDGDELPPYEPPTWSKERALAALKITEKAFDLIDGNVQGFSTPDREVAINPVAVYPFKTLMHELGHIVAGHTSAEQLQEYQTHRGLKEFEAEASAYLILNELGALEQFNASESRDYIQTWLRRRKEKPDEKSIRRVFATADKILRAGYPEEEKKEEA